MEIEFLDAAEARARLKPLDISIAADELGVTGIVIGDAIASISVDFASETHPDATLLAAHVRRVPSALLPAIVEAALHKLHCHEALAIPKTSWRNITDVVSETLKGHSKWSRVDAELGVEVNTADALVIRPTEHRLIRDLTAAILEHGEGPRNGLLICATSGLLAIDITPPGEVAFDVASELLAIEIRALAEHMRAPS